MTKFGIGQSVPRKEDPRLLTGRGRFVDDRNLPDQLHAHILRSPHAHARIARLDVGGARSAAGVVAVATGADLAADGIGGPPCVFMPEDSPPGYAPPYPALAQGRVRHVGEGIAMVVAETANEAADAAEEIVVEYEPLPVVVGPESAVMPGAPQLWDRAPGNVSFTWQAGDASAVAEALAGAARIIHLEEDNNRVVISAIEPRAALGDHDSQSERGTLYIGSQMPHPIKDDLGVAFGLPADRFRVVVEDVGGGFGAKNATYPEYVLVLWAARKLARPVKWCASRAEAFLSDYHGRANRTTFDLALDEEGRFLGLEVDVLADLGAYVSSRGAVSPIFNQTALAGPYTTPAIHVRVRGVFTNTVPTDVYRGAGRPEAIYGLERLIDLAAAELGLDRVDLRRRNLIAPESFPYETPLGLIYDSGQFADNLDAGLARADWDGFAARRAAAEQRGRLRGIGFTNYVERCGAGVTQGAELRIAADGRAEVLIGTMSNGQGHETAYAQVVAELLGLDLDSVSVVEGDTDRVAEGEGTGGSRSIPLGGAAISLAADEVIDKARRIAAHLMEAAPADIEFTGGRFAIAGTDRHRSWTEIAAAAHDPSRLPADIAPGLDGAGEFVPPNHTFPAGCHVCEVEIDPETGGLQIVAYTIVHDFGRLLNPMLLAGQVHGGVVQGLGQAAFEHTAYGTDGQLLAGSWMDYCLPRADDLPAIGFTSRPTPCPSNPLGFKGCGEAGAAGSPPALANAVMDAVAPYGVRHIDLPLTPERIWRAIGRGT
ncbi:MAG: xanthine dehydrogenase family protein molybdopterin-binding subunit [Alphaproteobacteria bacterium]|nr:xanthine dehydrogenase family protein molybdopterin-binding subunit [Alphaproteobacteria bacterium]MDP6515283.1 xanthine dehydrogenase family protein molybdopterin-binding subunit [Alphaproteobacteria bacterium]